VHHHPAGSGLDQPIHHAEQRGLTRSAAPEQRGGTPAGDLKLNAVEDCASFGRSQADLIESDGVLR
jgi:hypothetical protein